MKKIVPGLLLLLSTIFTSCSQDSTDKDEDGTNNSKLVQKEHVSDNYNLQYRYNDSRLLSQITDIFSEQEIHNIISFTYDSNKNIIERRLDSQTSTYESTTTYRYDNQNRIISSEMTSSYGGTTTFTYTYSGNLVEVVENNRGYESTINLELNEKGLVTRISESEGYSTFDYDANGNLETIKSFSEAGELKFFHEYSYDSNPNPFFGQLNSLYLPRFIDVMEDLLYGENIFYPYQGYLLPYMKNNITGLTYYSSEHPNWTPVKKTYSYNNDSDGYPVEVTEMINGNSSFIFDIKYN